MALTVTGIPSTVRVTTESHSAEVPALGVKLIFVSWATERATTERAANTNAPLVKDLLMFLFYAPKPDVASRLFARSNEFF
jgi:hypothetical protein